MSMESLGRYQISSVEQHYLQWFEWNESAFAKAAEQLDHFKKDLVLVIAPDLFA